MFRTAIVKLELQAKCDIAAASTSGSGSAAPVLPCVALSTAVNRFMYLMLPRRIQLEAKTNVDWTQIITTGRRKGEEALISECMSYEYCVRRALVAIRLNNNGFMGSCSLLRIISNSVATSQFCRLTKIINAECCFVTGLLHPSKIKVDENDSEGIVVLAQLRSMTPDQMSPDDDIGVESHLCGITEALDFYDDSSALRMDRFIDHVMQAMDRYKKPQVAYYEPALFGHLLKQYSQGPVSTWNVSDGERHVIDPHGITETASEVQRQGDIRGTNETVIKRLCQRVTVFVLFVEACAIKTILNTWKASNAPKSELIVKRALLSWNANIQYIASQQSTWNKVDCTAVDCT